MKIYTVGHSNLSSARFLDLIKPFGIEVIADVRKIPYSRYATWTQKKRLLPLLESEGLEYLYLGKELGGKPREKITDFYDRERNPLFVVGIQKLIETASEKTTVIFCSEAKPGKCHRQTIIGRHLVNRGWEVLHILRDGSTIEQQPMLL